MNSHPETFLGLDELGSRFPPYLPTHTFPGKFIDQEHEALSRSPVKNGVHIQIPDGRWWRKSIPGWLRVEDALKLYELAFFGKGPILELGSYCGLSTAILSRASLASAIPKQIRTVDLDRRRTRSTIRTLRKLGLDRYVIAESADALSAVKRFAAEGLRFDVIFVDHCHGYDAVVGVCRELDQVMLPGGFCLFHDANDSRNRDLSASGYGVYRAIQNGLPAAFEFYGIFGCAALYRNRI